jgi:hypothetical protein
MALCAKVVDFIGLCLLDDTYKIACIGKIAVVHFEMCVLNVRILVEVIHPLGVEEACPALDAVHNVTFFKKKFCQVRAILASNAGDEGDFVHGLSFKIVKGLMVDSKTAVLSAVLYFK